MQTVILTAAKHLRRCARYSIAASVLLATAAGAQQRGTIAGSVIDATSGSGLSGATVTITAADGLGVLSQSSAEAPRFAFARTVPTSSAGDYRFTDLPAGTYRLYVRRIGYVPTALDIRLGDAAASPLSIGLVVSPVRLRAVEVRATEQPARIDPRTDPDDRVATVRARQRAFLATDVRDLTTTDVAESATLGGGDVLRALQRLPGVTPLDDWSAKLLVRGNRWDHDRIYFDDLPLFDPLGALGRASGVTTDAIGAAFLHPGVRPVALGGEGATRIDLHSRPATSTDEWRASTTLSQLGLAGSAERTRADGVAGVALTAQHSVAGWFSNSRPWNGALGDPVISDAQASLRADVRLHATSALEMSAIANDDARYWPSSSDASSVSQRWGNVAGRLTYRAVVGRFVASHTVGATHFESHASDWTTVAGSDENSVTPTKLATQSTVDYLALGGRITGESLPTVGYDLVTQRASLSGPRERLYWGDVSLSRDERASGMSYGSIWVDHRAAFGERVAVEGGVRADVGGPRGIDAVRPAGALQMRYTASSRLLVSAGVSRTTQYAQSLELPIVAHGPTTPSLWVMSGHDVPAMSVDNASVGAERWVGDATLLTANVYARRTTGAIVGDPTPGPLSARPLFVVANENARGVELSARKLSGRVTGFASYAYNLTTTHAASLSYPSNATRPHAFDLVATGHVGRSRLSAAFKATSGAPYTRVTAVDGPSAQIGETNAFFSQGIPNALRLPSYASLDAFVDHAIPWGRSTFLLFAGAQNLLGRTNRTWFQLSGICDGEPSPMSSRCAGRDLVEAPIRFTPSVGIKLAF